MKKVVYVCLLFMGISLIFFLKNNEQMNSLSQAEQATSTAGESQALLDSISYNEGLELIEKNTTLSKDIIVAVIDTGCDLDHEDLGDNLWTNEAEMTGEQYVDDDGNGYIDDIHGFNFVNDNDPYPEDNTINSHGTHVAGILSMTSGNEIGGDGINYHIKTMILKAGGGDNKYRIEDVKNAINYAKAMNADVINLSFGSTGLSEEDRNKLNEALRVVSGQAFIVAAAGNDSLPTSESASAGFTLNADMYPASFDFVTGVMACDFSLPSQLYEYSNWDYTDGLSKKYTIVAPGKNIYSTTMGDSYGYLSGTSMATPIVSGVAAILMNVLQEINHYDNRADRIADVEHYLLSSQNTLSYTDSKGKVHTYPKLNLLGSLKSIYSVPTSPSPSATASPSPSPSASASPSPSPTPTSETIPTNTPSSPPDLDVPKDTLATPKAPITQAINGTHIKLKISNTTKANRYALYRSTSPTKKGQQIATLNAAATTYRDYSVKKGVYYYYSLQSISNGNELNSNLSTYAKAIVPKVPTFSLMVMQKNRTLRVLWKRVAKATGYEIRYERKKNKVTKTTIRRTKTRRIKFSMKKYVHVKIRTYTTIKGRRYYSKYLKLK